MKDMDFGPLWAEINLDTLSYNAKEIIDIVDEDTIVMGVVKANGYGHGAIEVGKTLLESGFKKLAVATVKEAIELRKNGIQSDILVLGFTQKRDYQKLFDYDITQTVYSLEQGEALSKLGQENNKKLKIHIKLETGMARLGFLKSKKSIDEIIRISKLDGLELEGIFSHFATADSKDKSFVRFQYDVFSEMVEEIEKHGLYIPIKHISNSAAIIDLPEYNLDMVRPGIIQYGLYPSNEVDKSKIDLKPILKLKSKISHIKELDTDTGIGYGLTHRTKRKSKIATIPVGYADGYSRLLSNIGEVGIKGHRAPIVGNVCMDQIMVDITGIEDVKLEDEVILIGNGEDNSPRIEELAEKIGTINYEIATLIGRRIPRVYIKNGKVVEVVDYVMN